MRHSRISPTLHLVTGAGGYLGGELVCQLRAAGLPVRALVRDERTFRARHPDPAIAVLLGDLADRLVARRAVAGVGVVYHCATEHRPGALRRNRQAARALIDACARHDAHLLYPACSLIYGPQPGQYTSDHRVAQTPAGSLISGPQPARAASPTNAAPTRRIGEDAPLHGHGGLLPRLQRGMEVELVTAAREGMLRATRLRLPPLIGASLDLGAGAALFRRVQRGRPFLDAFPSGRWVEYLDLRDAARCLIRAAATPAVAGWAINVPGCGPIRRHAFLALLAVEAGVPLRAVPLPGAALRLAGVLAPRWADLAIPAAGDLLLDGAQAEALLGYVPQYSYQESIHTCLAGSG